MIGLREREDDTRTTKAKKRRPAYTNHRFKVFAIESVYGNADIRCFISFYSLSKFFFHLNDKRFLKKAFEFFLCFVSICFVMRSVLNTFSLQSAEQWFFYSHRANSLVLYAMQYVLYSVHSKINISIYIFLLSCAAAVLSLKIYIFQHFNSRILSKGEFPVKNEFIHLAYGFG